VFKRGLVLAAFCAVSLASAAWADGWDDLRAAIYYNQEAEVARLLDSGADINMRNAEGWTPLHIAAEQGMTRMVRYLLARGADANAVTEKGRTPYDVAAGYSEVQGILKARMKPAADPFAAVLGKAPAKPAATAPSTERSRNGLNDGRNASNRPRLEARDAVWYNNIGQLTAILDEGLDVNALDETGRETLLHAAAWRDRIEIAKLLLARGASKTIRDKDGKLAADYAQSPAMRALLGAGSKAAPAQSKAPAKGDDHCKVMWREATALCSIGNSSCNTNAHIKYQACLKKGTWY
jgi:ankyrin repeat protein